MNEILIYDDIGEGFFGGGVTALSVKSQLDKLSGDIKVRINSPGGDVFDGFAIHNLLKDYDGQVDVVVDGLAASAASVIAMAGDTITMADNALMMIHDPWTIALGSSEDMSKTAELLDKIKGSIITTYQSQTSLDEDEISGMMRDETWFNTEEAIEKGFATAKAEAKQSPMNLEKRWIKNAPKQGDVIAIEVSQDAEMTLKVAAQVAAAIKEDPEIAIEPVEGEPWRLNLNKRRMQLI